jgi:RNA polymerase sigma-70 factor (ECF subfamily)
MNKDRDIPDEQLIERSCCGDRASFNLLFERYRKMVFSLAYNLTGNINDAEDITQDTFVNLYKNLHKFRGESSFKTWFYRIVINQVRSHHRKTRFMLFTSILTSKEGKEMEIKITDNKTPEEELHNRELQKILKHAILALPLKQREVFIMKHIKGLKIKEIAHILNSSEGTVKANLFKAVRNLQSKIKELQ